MRSPKLAEDIRIGRAFRYRNRWYKLGWKHLWIWVNRKGWKIYEGYN
jgi:hypothetical protein